MLIKCPECELQVSDKAVALSIGSDYLFNDKGQTHAGRWEITYDKYANRFKNICKTFSLNPEHRPHDLRKTFFPFDMFFFRRR